MTRLLLVSGMHRSGTSALAGALAAAGVDFGEHLLAPQPGQNDRGYFEDERIMHVHEELLVGLGGAWYAPHLPEGWLQTAQAKRAIRELQQLVSDLLARSDLVGIKDPRLCVLLPLWRRVTAELDCDVAHVISLRAPREVVASVSKRDAIGEALTFLNWSDHYLDVVRESTGQPRVFVPYTDLLNDEQRTLMALADSLGVALHTGGATFADAALRHQVADANAVSCEIETVANGLWQQLQPLAATPDAEPDLEEFADALNGLRNGAPIREALAARSAALESQLEAHHQLVQRLNKIRVGAEETLKTLEQTQQHVLNLEALMTGRDEALVLAGEQQAALEARASGLASALEKASDEATVLRLEQTNAMMEMARLTEVATIQSEALEEREAANGHLATELAVQGERIETERALHARTREALRRERLVLHKRNRELSAAEGALGVLTQKLASSEAAGAQAGAEALSQRSAAAHLQGERDTALQVAEHLRRDIQAIRSSTAWRATAIVRSLVAAVRRTALLVDSRNHQIALQPTTGAEMIGGRFTVGAGGRLRLISDLGRLPAGRVRVDVCIEGADGLDLPIMLEDLA